MGCDERGGRGGIVVSVSRGITHKVLLVAKVATNMEELQLRPVAWKLSQIGFGLRSEI
jgi:hypothetical protein